MIYKVCTSICRWFSVSEHKPMCLPGCIYVSVWACVCMCLYVGELCICSIFFLSLLSYHKSSRKHPSSHTLFLIPVPLHPQNLFCFSWTATGSMSRLQWPVCSNWPWSHTGPVLRAQLHWVPWACTTGSEGGDQGEVQDNRTMFSRLLCKKILHGQVFLTSHEHLVQVGRTKG